MENKRYAIVRVDNRCPDEFEKINVEYICRNISCYQGKECSKNFYGDTKEQLIRKIAQGIIIASKKKQIYIANPKAVSKIIIEFLGVKE